MSEALRWWQRGVIYEIYVRSFQDQNGDGAGDLNGISQRLDYLQWLGIDAIWLTPFYVSPMRDFGYDVADYTAVDPVFGTMADFDRLLAAVHARNMRLIVDLVPNHTSDQHPWFREAAVSRSSPKRDWYIWADPSPDGAPPNNWRSEFGGSACDASIAVTSVREYPTGKSGGAVREPRYHVPHAAEAIQLGSRRRPRRPVRR